MAAPVASDISASMELHSALQRLLDESRAELDKTASGEGVGVDTDQQIPESSGSDSQDPNKRSRVRDQKEQRAPLAAKQQRPQRIPTYYMRKEEKATLTSQLQVLEAQLVALKREHSVSTGIPRSKALQRGRRALVKKHLENEVVREAVQGFQLSLAGIQSAVGGHLSSQSQLPFQSHIRLGTDWKERDATLLAMKDKKLLSAQQYFAERTRFLDRSAHFVESSQFKTREGHLRTMRFDVIPFEGITSVKQVFDALLFYFFNMEISISEVLGDITIREDDGIRLQGISQNRLISSIHGKVQVESNSVMFCKLVDASEAGGEGEIGVIVADSVNEDELYPYSPETRLRNDVTAAVTVSLQPRKKINRLTGQEEEEELVVVMTCTCLLSLRPTELPIPAHEIEGLRESVESWGDAMLKTVRDILYSRHAAFSTSGAAARAARASSERRRAARRAAEAAERGNRRHMPPQADNAQRHHHGGDDRARGERGTDIAIADVVMVVPGYDGGTEEDEQEQEQESVSDSSSLLMLHEPSGLSGQEEDEAATSKRKKRYHQQQQQRQSANALATKRPRAAPEEPSDSKTAAVDPKVQKMQLQLQLQLLETQIASLQSGRSLGLSTPKHKHSSLQSHLHAILRRQMENEVLRQSVMHSELQQSAFGGRLMPFESPIRLGSNWDERQAALLAMRDRKLQSAYRYVSECTRNLDLCTPFSESSRFVSRSGELCVLQCDVVPFEGITSVKTVFDAVLFYLFNMESSISEVLGDITIREDDGTRLFQGISQNRLLSNVRDKVQVEINSAMFCNLYAPGELGNNERECGVLIADFVDDDALYPYSPGTRLRHDITATSRITLEPRKRVSEISEQETEFILVLTRIASPSLHPTELSIPDHQMHELRVTVENWGDVMLKTVQGIVYPERGQLSSKVRQPMAPAREHQELTELTTSALTEFVV